MLTLARPLVLAVPLVLTLVLALVLAAACDAHRGGPGDAAPSAPVPVGSSSRTITVDGRDRTFDLYRPGTLPTDALVPLVVMLHGGFGSGSQAEASYGWDALAEAEHFVVAYPDGVGKAWAVGGGCCGIPAGSGVDDVAFIRQLVASISRVLPIDSARVYATGISNGGMLAYRLACDTTLFAAIGPDSATMLGPCKFPAPISVIHIHGTADRRIRYGGGEGEGVAAINGPAVPDLVAAWRRTDRCPDPSVTTDGAVSVSTASCPDGRGVELVTIAGAGHQWPGAKAKPVVERLLGLDPPSTALDATATIWRFFQAHPGPRRGLRSS
jgi:polyhydroxybutyrate depolymerase